MARLEERDLRSLERPSMYSIFAPLDADERLTREQLMEAKRHRPLGRRELAGVLWLPALVVLLTLEGWAGVSGFVGFGLVIVAFLGFCAFAVSDRR